MIFVKIWHGSLRPCIDYWKLNHGTIKDGHPRSLIVEILAQMSKVKYIFKIEISDTYSLIRLRYEVS
jgi:hypothetical protein